MSSISSVPSLTAIMRPAALYCADCTPSDVGFDPLQQDILKFSWSLCILHQSDPHATPLNPFLPPSLPTPSQVQPSPTRPSPTRPIYPTATRAFGAGPAVTIPLRAAPVPAPAAPAPAPTPAAAAPAAPAPAPAPAAPAAPAPSAPAPAAPYSRSDVVQASRAMYERVKMTVMDPLHPHTIKGALAQLNIANRTFQRRRWIAELDILDATKLQQLITTQQQLYRRPRVSVESLNDNAKAAIHATRALRDARAAGMACGRLI